MPTSEAPIDVNEPREPAAPSPGAGRDAEPVSAAQGAPEPALRRWRSSRWVDYDTHELLEMISELEDERRWARLREGVLWALLSTLC